jgi:hypothetical protein
MIPGDPDHDGAANYLASRLDAQRVQATSDVARHFLGRSMDCQQCHDDPHFGGGKQAQFWELNAFLRQLVVTRGADNRPARLEDTAIASGTRDGSGAGVFYNTPGGLNVALPVFLDGSGISLEGTQVNRRQELSRLITGSPDFSRHMANLVWSAVVGRGFVPFDQTVRDNVLNHPEPLAILGDQFAAHNFEMRKLVNWAVRSEPFQRSAGPESLVDMGSAAGAPLFDRYYEPVPSAPRRARETLAAALKNLGSAQIDSSTTARVGTLPPFPQKGKGKGKVQPPQPPPAIFAASGAPPADPMVKVILASPRLTDKQRAEHLFRMALHRPPRPAEETLLDQFLAKSGNNPQDGLEAIWTALDPRGSR